VKRKQKALKPFDPYEYYSRAVQSPEADCQFISDTYKELRGKRPHDLREDFCAAFALCCEWVRRNKHNRALGIDLDVEPLEYGTKNYLPKLRPEQRSRVRTLKGSVLTATPAPVDVVAAFNFSYFLFKSRMVLRRYFKRVHKGLRKDGLFILDCFGGSDVQGANEEKSKIGEFYYFWDQTNYEPISNEAVFHIHFKRPGEKKRERVFTYDWRVWTIPEIRETLLEAGFRRTYVYWEGTKRNGEGNGVFTRTENGEECEGWVAYLIGEK
jgi:SAM-dependent methyltransferase